jgi:beta-lactamase class A
MIKLPIAAALAARCAAGREHLDRRVRVSPADVTTNDAGSPFVTGYEATLGEFATAMLSASDNVATNTLIDVLGRAELTRDALALGLAATAVRRKLSGSLPLIDDPAAVGRNAHPARDAATLLRGLAEGRPATAGWIVRALEAQLWNDKLPRGLREGDRFAHKTGDTDEVSHDGGILTLANGRRFVLVVYTALPSSPEADARLAAFARALRPQLDV